MAHNLRYVTCPINRPLGGLGGLVVNEVCFLNLVDQQINIKQHERFFAGVDHREAGR